MNSLFRKMKMWINRLDFGDPEKNLSAQYIQVISILIVIAATIISIVYAIDGYFNYVYLISLEIVVYTAVIALIRFKKLQIASSLFLIAALVLLAIGILTGGGIHASSSVMYPVILVFASLLLQRKNYILYIFLCVVSIGFIIYAEYQGLTPVEYVPDPPSFPLFITYTLIIITAGIVIRSITENLQTSSQIARQYSQELLAQKNMLDRVGQAVVGCGVDNKVIYWNRAATDLYGWEEDEALGKIYYDLIPTALTLEIEHGIRDALRRGTVWSGELVVQNKNS